MLAQYVGHLGESTMEKADVVGDKLKSFHVGAKEGEGVCPTGEGERWRSHVRMHVVVHTV